MGDIEPPILRTVRKVAEIPADQWNACANPHPGRYNPFTDHAFLLALEESGSAVPETGWSAQHLIIENSEAGQIAGIVPLYLKSHSQGEYIFDYGWAEAWHRAGGQYYPKLLSAIPF
ncbi:MAG: peptidogalycan biosysnthesis protein, partial [Pseudomonadota bacterium]|nr:peptidogalycan biosysnthesis protein [Pseudomonadota bacterium]